LADTIAALAELGVELPPGKQTAETITQVFQQRDDPQNSDRLWAEIVDGAPKVKRARAKLDQARCVLKEAKLDLRHCDITAEIDGDVVRVEVVPGSYVDAGQQLAIIRSNGNR
jgi:multidrug resistance efflux pump